MEDSSDNRPERLVKKPDDLTPRELIYLHDRAFDVLRRLAEVGAHGHEGDGIQAVLEKMHSAASDIQSYIDEIAPVWQGAENSAIINAPDLHVTASSTPYEQFLTDKRRYPAYFRIAEDYWGKSIEELPATLRPYAEEPSASHGFLRIIRLLERAGEGALFIKDAQGTLIRFDGKNHEKSTDGIFYTRTGEKLGEERGDISDVNFNHAPDGKGTTVGDASFEALVDAADRFFKTCKLPLPLGGTRNLFPDIEMNRRFSPGKAETRRLGERDTHKGSTNERG